MKPDKFFLCFLKATFPDLSVTSVTVTGKRNIKALKQIEDAFS